jgi:putative membrane protein insertion efficiency factor
MHKILLLSIRAYQLLASPLLGNNCRFYPSCSHYALEAIERHGPLVGIWLALRRVLRCHPWHPGGVDPVPELSKKIR